jgi:hypothetical protein
MPNEHNTMQPASKLTPPSIPIPWNMGLANRIAANANALLLRLLALKMLAAYVG